MMSIIERLAQAPEVLGFGPNVATVMFIVAISLNTWQGYGLFMQNRKIWRKRSLQGLAPLFFVFQVVFFISFETQSIIFNTIGGIYAGALLFLHLPILAGVFRFGEITAWTTLALVAIPIPPILMIFFPGLSGEIFLAASAGTVIANLVQPFTMWREKKVGAVEPRMFFPFLAASIVWAIYPAMIGNWPIAILSGIFGTIYAVVLVLYYRYREEPIAV